MLAVLRTDGVVRRTLRFLRDLTRLATFDGVHARWAFGLDDPADTGRLYGALGPACLAAGATGFDVACQPTFDGASFEGACGGRVTVRPISVVAVVVLTPARTWAVGMDGGPCSICDLLEDVDGLSDAIRGSRMS